MAKHTPFSAAAFHQPFKERKTLLCRCGAIAHFIGAKQRGYCPAHRAEAVASAKQRVYAVGQQMQDRSCSPWLDAVELLVTAQHRDGAKNLGRVAWREE